MNTKLIALISVAVLIAVPVGYYGYHTYGPHDFAAVYDDCYMEVQDAQSLFLKNTASHNSRSLRSESTVLGTNIEHGYGSNGNTLYKSTLMSESEEVQMYTLDDDADTTDGGAVEDRNYQYIDRDVKEISELVLGDKTWILIVFYGLESDTDSYQCYMSGYRYDPNSQLYYLVDDETGKMYNVTQLYRGIVPVNLLTFEVYDAHYELHFPIYDGVQYVIQVDNELSTNKVLYLEFGDTCTITTLASASGREAVQSQIDQYHTVPLYPAEYQYFYGGAPAEVDPSEP